MTPRLRTHLRPTIVVGLIGICAIAAAGTTHVAALGAPPDSIGFLTGQSALDRLGDRLPAVAAEYGMNPGELRQLLLDDNSLALDSDDGLAYFDVLAPGESAAAPAPAGEPAAAPPLTDPVFGLASLPGAAKTIYLDFDGHVTEGTTWNSAYGVTTITSPPYDTDGRPDSWSSSELDVIRKSWEAAAEDFAPWNVNVTTIDPGTEALRRFGTNDTQWGARVVITKDTFANCGCGGHAYIGSFDDSADEPTFVYNSSLVGVKEAISHEVGHMLNLAHDGSSTSAYYQGHGSGATSWAPIMGVAYYVSMSQWSQQEYYGANNTGSSANYGYGADDIAVISSTTNGNGFGLKLDDHGNSAGTATALTSTSPSASGIIGTRNDVDVFAFSAGAGTVSFTANPAPSSPNLDIKLTLRDSAGTEIASSNLIDALTATVSVTVTAGDYTLEVDGVGVGSPASNPPSGYSDYASIGQFSLTGSVPASGPTDTTAPAAPTGLNATIELNGDVRLSWDANTESDLAGYTIGRSSIGSGPFTSIATQSSNSTAFVDTTAAPGSQYYVVTASDTSGNTSQNSNTATVVVPVDLTTNATSETSVVGSVSGSLSATTARGGAVQTITEVDSGGKPNQRHDLAEHRWAIPASVGSQTLTVVASATGGGDADTGFYVEWSTDGSTWVPFATVENGKNIDATLSIGAPTGTVWVRVIDTDRTATERSHNSISVDLIEIAGNGVIVDNPQPSLVVASISTSLQGAGRGEQYGVVTVQVNDDLGAAIEGASVSVQLSGSFVGTLSGTTGSDGSVTMQTTVTARKPSFTACVASVTYTTTTLTYSPGGEACQTAP